MQSDIDMPAGELHVHQPKFVSKLEYNPTEGLVRRDYSIDVTNIIHSVT